MARLGENVLQGKSALKVLTSLAAEIARVDNISHNEGAMHLACATDNMGVLRLLLQVG